MESRSLGAGGPRVPVAGMGTWQTLDVTGPLEAERRALVHAALDAGSRLIDTSPMYGHAERVVAAALREHRGEAFIAT